jgi:hypothetical protein
MTHEMRDAVAARNPLRPFLPDSFFSVLSEIASAWIEGPKIVRAVIAGAVFFGITALILHVIDIYRFLPNAGSALVSVLGILAGAALTIVVAYRDAKKTAAAKVEYEAVERRARENPDEPSAAWDLARIKLESYLDRNLSQVSWIFVLVLLMMSVGFAMVGFGIWLIYKEPHTIGAAVVASVSGIVSQFIAGTFLLIYRSTMAQAREYVTVLERITAVGMSIQILQSIEGAEPQLRNSARAELARDLLRMYGVNARKPAKSNPNP